MRSVLVLALLATGCINDKPRLRDDAGVEPMPDAMADAMVDAPPEELTFTKYVIDLITLQTTNITAPRPASEFANLPDPDGAANNTAAYQSLF